MGKIWGELLFVVCIFALPVQSLAAQLQCTSLFLRQPAPVLQGQVDRAVELIKNSTTSSRGLRPQTISLRARKAEFLNFLYKSEILRADELSMLLTDKLLIYKVMEYFLGDRATVYHPRALGLNEFLASRNLVDHVGGIHVSESTLTRALEEAFPEGFVIKPVIGLSSGGKNIYFDAKEVVRDLLAQNTNLYKPTDFLSPYISPVYSVPLSGEKFMLMGLIKDTAAGSKDTTYGNDNEFRTHSFYKNVVPGTTQTRWYTPDAPNKVARVEKFVQEFLDSMPSGFTLRSAYSFDVFIGANGRLQLIEINTNNGRPGGWSGFLRLPHVLGAHTRFLRERYGITIEGTAGFMFYNDLANAVSHLKHDIPEWIKDAEVHGLDEQSLAGLRELLNEYSLRALNYQSNPNFQKNEDFLKLLTFGKSFAEKLEPVKTVGDAHWQKFLAWSKTLGDL